MSVSVCLNRRVIVSKRVVTPCLVNVSVLLDGLDSDAIKVTSIFLIIILLFFIIFYYYYYNYCLFPNVCHTITHVLIQSMRETFSIDLEVLIYLFSAFVNFIFCPHAVVSC